MKITLNQNPKGAWFPYFGSKINDEGKIEYEHPANVTDRVFVNPPLQAEELEKIYAQTRTRKSQFVLNPKKNQMEHVTFYDQTPEQSRKEFEMIFCAVIGDYELVDEKGVKIPVSDENKTMLMRNQEFARFIARCLELLQLTEEDRKRALEKN